MNDSLNSYSVTLLLALLVFAFPAQAQNLVGQINDDIENSHYTRADESLRLLESGHPNDGVTLFLRGKWEFHQGRYDRALELLDRAATVEPHTTTIAELQELVRSTREVVQGMTRHVTESGRFEILYDASRDAALIPWAEETLDAAWEEVGRDLNFYPQEPVRVEIYPRARTLARVSPLTEEAIEASGTIALCKYNKLMMTSPRATALGYGWRDTLTHEYVHYVVSHLTHVYLPIWLHEAIAKYLENRWTGETTARLEPQREALLTRRIREGRLITFEQMHPSMAYLPTTEDASTAYAEVFTVMEYLEERRGRQALADLLRALRDGATVEGAFQQVVGDTFDVFERNWMRWLGEREQLVIPGDFEMEVQLRPEGAGDAPVDRWAGVGSIEARDYLRLGELMRARGFLEGALAEYRKAEQIVGDANPLLQNALARAALDLGQAAQALEAVQEVRRWHPDFYRSHLHWGEAALELGRVDEAIEALVAAGGINPFDPAIHTLLAQAYDAKGLSTQAAWHRMTAQELNAPRGTTR